MTNRFTQKAQNTLKNAQKLSVGMGHSYIGSEHLILALASEKDSISAKILSSCGAAPKKLKDALILSSDMGTPSSVHCADMTPRAKKIIENAADESIRDKCSYIGTEHLLSALLCERDCSGVKLLESCGISSSDIRAEIAAYSVSSEKGKMLSSKSAKKEGAAVSGAPTLSLYGKDLTHLASIGKLDPTIGREKETEHLICVLSRRIKNNPCLVGEAGVGKTAVIEGLAQKISEHCVPEALCNKRIVTLDISAMIAGAKYRGEFEERLKNVMDDVLKNPDIILFIDEFHMIIGAGAAEGALDAANILKPALARGEVQIIGATTISEYRAHIEKDAALERRFQPINVPEPTEAQALEILRGLRPRYEEHHKLKISDSAISAAIKLSVRYIPDRFLPDKAIDLIDEAAAKRKISSYIKSTPNEEERLLEELSKKKEQALISGDFTLASEIRQKQKKIKNIPKEDISISLDLPQYDISIDEKDIAEIVTSWTSIPLCEIVEGEEEKLKRLEEILNSSVIGQHDAVCALSKAIKRGRIGLKDANRPIASFIFSGKTGVGKTELAKKLAELLFGTSDALLRFDMSEYMEKHSVSKLIGSPPGYVGYGEGGQLTERVRRRPYSVLLFDEIEKAHPDVFNLLLSVLEDGILSDSAGRKTDFKNTVIIMTSNIGSECNGSIALGFSNGGKKEEHKNRSDKIKYELKSHFSPEFLNRVDDIIVFNSLTKKDIAQIAAHMLSELTERGKEIGLTLKIDDSVPDYLSEYAYDENFGARSIRRAIVHKIEDEISSMVIDGILSKGDIVKISVNGSDLVFLKAESAIC